MPRFEPDRPQETSQAFIEVESLPPGQHKFRLVVEDQFGNKSEPDEVVVTVRRIIV
ncbi:MAG TPA: hypothetical protein VNI02_07990 [Blastocatellia bacterium]|jgi:hypothetical protein|nr:hypothetical protein [Blastocatellia bacterium]